MAPENLKKTLNALPNSPGVYKYFDSEGTLIYIGKAKNLKKRVSSYFSKQHYENRKTAVLVSRIADIQFTLVETEMDALLLENALIKQFQPKFNINLKDDKTYPFICLKHERFPRLFPTRNVVKDGSEYFGPYASVGMMHTILDLIRALYPIRNCNLVLSESNIRSLKFKPCLELDIGNCLAPCVARQSEEDYVENIRQVRNILKGNLSEVKTHLKKAMAEAAELLRFEEAARYKKRIDMLENYQSKSTIVNGIPQDLDVFSVVSDEKFAFINYLKVSSGMIIQTQTFELKKKMEESDEELLTLAIAEVRETYKSTSRELIVPIQPDLEDDKLTITIPKAGEKKKLLDLSLKNALYYKKEKLSQYEKLNPEFKTERLLNQLKSDLRLNELPVHMECFDNSNFQGTNAVSACVVFRDGKPSKKDYRIFNVKTVVGPNDFATMEEVIFRRYKRLKEENQPLPQLIVIDGGKGQLSSAIESLKKLDLYGKVAVIGIAKRLEELYYPEDELPLYLDKKSETLRVIQQMRDEAHRFGITHHRKKRSRNTFVSELEQIDGIGEQSVQLLLKSFRSVGAIKQKSLEELSEVLGNSRAEKVYAYFNP
ncbi:MAG: excinuclease ABC subunit UvrC [Bacteroidia bacterium]|nr:excinuclease ABC subunit UvrC [Bacteroidia bacterium]